MSDEGFEPHEADPKIEAKIIQALQAQKIPARKGCVTYSEKPGKGFTYQRYVVSVPTYEPLEFTSADPALLEAAILHLIATTPPKSDFAGRHNWFNRLKLRFG